MKKVMNIMLPLPSQLALLIELMLKIQHCRLLFRPVHAVAHAEVGIHYGLHGCHQAHHGKNK